MLNAERWLIADKHFVSLLTGVSDADKVNNYKVICCVYVNVVHISLLIRTICIVITNTITKYNRFENRCYHSLELSMIQIYN